VENLWRDRYEAMRVRLPAYARSAGWTLCGMSVCVDGVIALQDADALWRGGAPPEAQGLGAELQRRAAAGIGGEIRVEWPGGGAWLDAALPVQPMLGGTSAHAARVLTLLGAPALLSLAHRSADQMATVDPDIFLAAGGHPTRAGAIAGSPDATPKVYVFEFTAGHPVGTILPPRSSRIIVRLHDLSLEDDTEFAALGPSLVQDNGAGILSGFSALGGRDLDEGVRSARALAQSWHAAGIRIVHLELAGYEKQDYCLKVLRGLSGSYTSLGMSLSEFRALKPGEGHPGEAMCRLGEQLGADRVCVHADDWAMSATRGDAAQERDALLAGCLLASARAENGAPVVPDSLPTGVRFSDPPPGHARDAHGWSLVSCASPYLERPATTLGLGDTFLAGCMLVLGQHSFFQRTEQ
jgi:hypothetical protein